MVEKLQELVDYRTARGGITQEALGKELGVTGITVSRWETKARKIDDDLLTKVSEHTGIAPELLRPDLAKLMGGAQ